MAFALAAPTFDDHHPLALVAGDETVADKFLQGRDVLRVNQVRQEPQPEGGLGRFGVISDRQPVTNDFQLTFLKAAI